MSTVKLPAEAEAYKVQTIAEGKRYDASFLLFNFSVSRQGGSQNDKSFVKGPEKLFLHSEIPSGNTKIDKYAKKGVCLRMTIFCNRH